MTFRVLQFPAEENTRVIRMRRIPESWMGSYRYREDSGFLSSWLDDSHVDQGPRHVNWGAISGLVLSIAISAGFWTGVALLVERLVR